MDSCYDYLGCDKYDCVMFKLKGGKPCWEVEGTLCNHIGIEMVKKKFPNKKKEEVCSHSACIYYNAMKKEK